jgi:hypothetical protein
MRKKKPVVLAALADDSRGELKSMLAELSGTRSQMAGANAKPARWSLRFSASGKPTQAPKIRLP